MSLAATWNTILFGLMAGLISGPLALLAVTLVLILPVTAAFLLLSRRRPPAAAPRQTENGEAAHIQEEPARAA